MDKSGEGRSWENAPPTSPLRGGDSVRHTGLPTWPGSLPPGQGVRRQAQGNGRAGITGFRSATGFEHFASSLFAKNLWQ
jgi:hypothetical protein